MAVGKLGGDDWHMVVVVCIQTVHLFGRENNSTGLVDVHVHVIGGSFQVMIDQPPMEDAEKAKPEAETETAI
eukprot:11007241-Ditylum_brightwellii.AAC.1